MNYIIKLIEGDYLSVGALTDVQLIYKNVPYEKAQKFEYKYAKYHYDTLMELSKLDNWELYYPVGIEEV